MPGGSRYWVDGYNVLLRLRLGEERSLEERRAELVARAAAAGIEAWIAFDSREVVHGLRSSLPRRVSVTFAPAGTTADELILDKVRRAPDLARVIVVSDDREVADGARLMGARTMATTTFGRMLKPAPTGAPTKERPLSQTEVQDWMKWFAKTPRKDA